MSTLYLIPTPLGERDFSALFPKINSEIINTLDAFVVENIREGRRFLKKAGFERNFDNVDFQELNEHTKVVNFKDFLKPALEGRNMGLLSDAGTPCVADPGGKVVAEAHRAGIQVVPLVGPNSIILSLMSSGLNGQSFAFNGYLPIEQDKRERQLAFCESLMAKTGQTQIFIETPYRNNHLMESILKVCQPTTRLCVAANVATDMENIHTETVAKWRKTTFNYHKQPAIFLLGR
ncbi:MAG: SAM-dependent methyltransferase [Bacteroidales bacterium]|nr:SAM-dependent methyltransferase [Bacteroidales bacterium]